jgi:hypothetical protein
VNDHGAPSHALDVRACDGRDPSAYACGHGPFCPQRGYLVCMFVRMRMLVLVAMRMFVNCLAVRMFVHMFMLMFVLVLMFVRMLAFQRALPTENVYYCSPGSSHATSAGNHPVGCMLQRSVV